MPPAICESGVAEETASSLPAAESASVIFLGSIHSAPIASGKLMKRTALPVSAGLKTFEPIPPKSPFATTTATAAPMTTIHTGIVGGQTSASITPETQAERFDTITGCFVSF